MSITETTAQFSEWRQSTWKRIDWWLLRWQARLESQSVNRFTPWVLAMVMFVILVGLALARSRSLEGGTQLAKYAQSTWLIGEGFKPVSSIVDGNLLAENASFVLYPISALTALLPTTTTLLVIQSAALSLGLVPLWRIARRLVELRFGASLTVAFAYAIYSAVHNLNLADFHPESIALPALLGAVFYGLSGKWWRFGLLVLLVLACRADLGLAVAGLGILLTVEGKRTEGWITFSVGIGWTLLAALWFQPWLNDGVYVHALAFDPESSGGAHTIVSWIFSHPIDFIQRIGSRDNFSTIVSLLAPVLFLPVVAPRYLLPAVPLYGLYLAADVPADPIIEAHQTVPMTAFVFVATVFALRRTGERRVEKINVNRRVLLALTLTASVFFVRDSASSPYERPWNSGTRDQIDVARDAAAELIPEDAAVRASPKMLPLLFERERLFELDTTGPEPDTPRAIDRVEWVIFDATEVPHWDFNRREEFDLSLGRAGFDRVFGQNDDEILVYMLNEQEVAQPPTSEEPG